MSRARRKTEESRYGEDERRDNVGAPIAQGNRI
jgi:hypothetical protein